jgi:flagellin-like protein
MVLHNPREYAIIMNSKAVSPVIGVILMVAITVILSAGVAVFLMGMDTLNTQHPPITCQESRVYEKMIRPVVIEDNGAGILDEFGYGYRDRLHGTMKYGRTYNITYYLDGNDERILLSKVEVSTFNPYHSVPLPYGDKE